MKKHKKSKKTLKDDKGKSDMSLLPLKTLQPVADVFGVGKQKYGLNNWKIEPLDWDVRLASTLRHLSECQEDPKAVDLESGKLHIAHAITNLLIQLYWLEQEKDDR